MSKDKMSKKQSKGKSNPNNLNHSDIKDEIDEGRLLELEEELEGFDIELGDDIVDKIDELVNIYENDIVTHIEKQYQNKTTKSDRLADKIAKFGGSWRFIIYMVIFLGFWVIWNSLPFTPFHFDPPAFILLNLVLSFTAAFQAPVIMMSQNRQAQKDKQQSIIDFAIDYKLDQEVDDIQDHLHKMEKDIIEIKQMLKDLKNNNS